MGHNIWLILKNGKNTVVLLKLFIKYRMQQNAKEDLEKNTMAINLDDVSSHAKAYGFILPSSQIYGGLQAVYDYGPYGTLLKKNLQNLWWKSMVQIREDIVGIDASILMEPTTWKASGHIEGFNDWFIDHKKSKKRYRLDHLLDDHLRKLDSISDEKKKAIFNNLEKLTAEGKGEEIAELFEKLKVSCPIAKSSKWLPAQKINLLFTTQVGAIEDKSKKLYLRPETAQGIFVNFLYLEKTMRMKIPFGVAQIGKAFRNELIARQFTFRMREFEQMEMQYFITPGDEEKWFSFWKKERMDWYKLLGIPREKLRLLPHKQLAHYASGAVDIEYEFPFGFKEIEGVHSRTDFDLKSHQQYSKKKLSYFDPIKKTSYIPYVIESSAGSDRLILMILCQALKVIKKSSSSNVRTYLKLPLILAPIKMAILPLIKKEPLIKEAKKILESLKSEYMVIYEEQGSIGKRYARQDNIGTPYCVTVDFQTLDDGTITLRDRDTMSQDRINSKELLSWLREKIQLYI